MRAHRLFFIINSYVNDMIQHRDGKYDIIGQFHAEQKEISKEKKI